jgi:ribonuclease HII
MHDDFPAYDFATHKGYVTREHQQALAEHGPCPQHRRRFVNVRRVERGERDMDLVEMSEEASDTQPWLLEAEMVL